MQASYINTEAGILVNRGVDLTVVTVKNFQHSDILIKKHIAFVKWTTCLSVRVGRSNVIAPSRQNKSYSLIDQTPVYDQQLNLTLSMPLLNVSSAASLQKILSDYNQSLSDTVRSVNNSPFLLMPLWKPIVGMGSSILVFLVFVIAIKCIFRAIQNTDCYFGKTVRNSKPNQKSDHEV